MKYPWKKDPACLPNTIRKFCKKLESTKRCLTKNPEYAKLYGDQIEEMEEMGFSSKVTEKEIEEWKGPIHYVAHHAVVRPEKKTTPIRIVFKSKCPQNSNILR